MEQRINKLKMLGFIEDQIQRIVSVFPNSIKLRPERLQESFDNLLEQGFTREETIFCIVHTPSIFGKKIETVKKQILLYKKIFGVDYKSIVLKNPRRMIQGYNKTDTRYEILKKRGITNGELLEDIFLSESQFDRKYKN